MPRGLRQHYDLVPHRTGNFLLLTTVLTLAPRDHITYCQARGLSGHTSPCGECAFLISRLRPRIGCLLGWSSTFLLLWTLAPHDYVIYYQARGLSGHTSPSGECACFILEDSMPLEAEKRLSPFLVAGL